MKVQPRPWASAPNPGPFPVSTRKQGRPPTQLGPLTSLPSGPGEAGAGSTVARTFSRPRLHKKPRKRACPPIRGRRERDPPRVTQPQTASREQTPALPARHRPPATRLCLAPPGKRQPRDPPGVAGPPGLPLPTLEGLPWPGGGRPGPGRARLGGLRDDLAVTAATLHPLHWGPERPGPRRCPALDGRPT